MIQAQLLNNLCGHLKLPSIRKKAISRSEDAFRQSQTHLDYLISLLEQEWQERQERSTQRRIKTAHFPWLKTLESFDFNKSPDIKESLVRTLATGQYIREAEPIIFLGEPGTGKTHLAIALGIQAATQGFNVRFVSAAELTNQLMEAKDARGLSKAVLRYAKPDLLIIDELGYLPLTQADAELFFQVLSKRQEHKPVIMTTNLPFSEWINIFPEPRLCKAVIDRVTHKAHIIETGDHSVRLAESIKLKRQKKKEDSTKNILNKGQN